MARVRSCSCWRVLLSSLMQDVLAECRGMARVRILLALDPVLTECRGNTHGRSALSLLLLTTKGGGDTEWKDYTTLTQCRMRHLLLLCCPH